METSQAILNAVLTNRNDAVESRSFSYNLPVTNMEDMDELEKFLSESEQERTNLVGILYFCEYIHFVQFASN